MSATSEETQQSQTLEVDNDPTYCPSTSEESEDNAHNTVTDKDVQTVNQPGRKRIRRTTEWKRNKRQTLRSEGKEYTDRKGNIHHEKKVQPYNHNCRFHCNNNVCEEKREQIFEDYWKLSDYNLQSYFLNSSVKRGEPCRKRQETAQSRSISCTYELGGHRVCKTFFIKTLDISGKRIENVIEKKKCSETGICPKDKRGKKKPANKVPDACVELVKQHINLFTRYVSHYSRSETPERKFLNPGLNIRKLYCLYTEFCKEKQVEPVKESFYRHIFNTSFNLGSHSPLKDTCATCDKLQITIEHGTAVNQEKAKVEKELHLRKAQAAKADKDNAAVIAKDNPSHVAICFDLQKMLPTPVLSCSKAYYARQLWTYHFCVHNLGDGNAFMFMWNESQASRGCLEIASCLLRFIKSLPSTVTHLTAFSDNAGGQNKSKFIVKFWLYVVRNTNIETVDHKFLISGHSFMECDRNFGRIENAKKSSDREIFVPQDWERVVAKANKKFMVIHMNDEDFITLDSVKQFFKESVTGIRNMQWLNFRKQEPWKLFYKPNLSELVDFEDINMKSRQAGRNFHRFPELSMKMVKPKIKYMKYKNLQELLPFVPPIHHDFYISLSHQNSAENEVREAVPTGADDSDDEEVNENYLDRIADSDYD